MMNIGLDTIIYVNFSSGYVKYNSIIFMFRITNLLNLQMHGNRGFPKYTNQVLFTVR